MTKNSLASKPHYPILDGLRGVAAVTVVAFHILEAHATSHFDQLINHGYLAVDFFFLLSGFVVGYAYDDRWGKMTLGSFFKRRLVRLQPMVIIGMITGACFFYFQDGPLWPAIHTVPVWKMIIVMLIGCTVLPVPLSMDIRGWNEMHPLDGPAWSLFFEYIANILYALFIRNFSKKALLVLVIITGGALIQLAVTGSNGDLVGGWSVEPTQLRTGFTRMLYPFFAGLLLCRSTKPIRFKNAFLLCSVLLLIVLAMPRIGGARLWMNGLYESLAIIVVFPLIVVAGTGGAITSKLSARTCKFLGDISYPLYITHYPFIYTYTAWISKTKMGLQAALPVAVITFTASILFAFACLKWYDEPVRAWLNKKLLPKNN